MPMYQYKDKLTGTLVDVIRTLDEWEAPPTREEAAPMAEDAFAAAQWERVTHISAVVKGRSWGPGKGYW